VPSAPWHDRSLEPAERVEALVKAMTLREKIHQLFGVWVGASEDGGQVAPYQSENVDKVPDLDTLVPDGLGQLTRPFGTAPVDPALGALSLARTQRRIAEAGRFGIPAVAHEESLAGFAAWGATAYPVPLSWGASFDPELVRETARAIGRDLVRVGIHQALAPVLDVARDMRWGRVEETIGEDPYLVGTIATAYVAGLEETGIVSTLKHFAGYSASKAGRNHAPVSMGPRERADVILPPFEMALAEGGARSVMHAYTDTDGIPSAADHELLTGLLRDTWGFTGTVVADYFGITFLHALHNVAEGPADAAGLALEAGVDVELPTVAAFGEPLARAVEAGEVSEELVDRALRRVLLQKLDLGLLDADWDPVPPALAELGVTRENLDAVDIEELRGKVDLDPEANRVLARRLAEEAVVLLSNDGTLPLDAAAGKAPARIALLGPTAEAGTAVLGCYSFPLHVGAHHPEVPVGLELPTLREALTAELPDSEFTTLLGTGIDDGDTSGIPAAVAAARDADLAVVALGDRAGLFGRGTTGEGCDAEDVSLPGVQRELLEAVLATGTPTVVVLFAGRPYHLGSAPEKASAIVQTFFPGEEGTRALAQVLTGAVEPSGHLPVSVPSGPGPQPSTYLGAPLAQATDVTTIDPTPAYAFGHGLSYTTTEWSDLEVLAGEAATDGTLRYALTLTNTGERPATELLQVYLHDPVASVVLPVQRLIAYRRVPLEPGQSRRVTVELPADLASFTGRDGKRRVEPGRLELRFSASAQEPRLTAAATLTGEVRTLDHTRRRHAEITVG